MSSRKTSLDEVTGYMLAKFEVTSARLEEQPLLERLVQLYLYDTSMCREAELDSVGLFKAPQLQPYLHGAERSAFVLRLGSTPIGFALIGKQVCSSTLLIRHSCHDLFVVRRYRRQGFGQAAAHALFTSFPGQWEVAAPAVNPPAQSFWRAVVDRFTGGCYSERWLEDSGFRGSVQTFVAMPPRCRPTY